PARADPRGDPRRAQPGAGTSHQPGQERGEPEVGGAIGVQGDGLARHRGPFPRPMIGRDVRRIAVVLLLVVSAAAIATAPEHAPGGVVRALISVAWPWREGWKATRGTALRPALVWAALAIAAAVAAQVVGWGEPMDAGRPGAGQATYLSTLAALAA